MKRTNKNYLGTKENLQGSINQSKNTMTQNVQEIKEYYNELLHDPKGKNRTTTTRRGCSTGHQFNGTIEARQEIVPGNDVRNRVFRKRDEKKYKVEFSN